MHLKFNSKSFTILRQSQLDQRAAALSFYTILSVVPLLAVLLSLHSVLQDRFFEIERWQNFLLSYLAPLSGAEFRSQIGEMVARNNAQFVGGSGLLFGAIILHSILSRIDSGMQKIWSTEKHSSHFKKAVIFLSQFFIIIPAVLFVVGSTFPSLFACFAVLFFFYKYFPNRHVNTIAAFTFSVVTSVLFIFGKDLFLGVVETLFHYNKIYGSFAFLPLLMTWIYMLWFLFFLGAIGSRYMHDWLGRERSPIWVPRTVRN